MRLTIHFLALLLSLCGMLILCTRLPDPVRGLADLYVIQMKLEAEVDAWTKAYDEAKTDREREIVKAHAGLAGDALLAVNIRILRLKKEL